MCGFPHARESASSLIPAAATCAPNKECGVEADRENFDSHLRLAPPQATTFHHTTRSAPRIWPLLDNFQGSTRLGFSQVTSADLAWCSENNLNAFFDSTKATATWETQIHAKSWHATRSRAH